MNYHKPFLTDSTNYKHNYHLNFNQNNAFNYQPRTNQNSLSKNFAFSSSHMTKMVKKVLKKDGRSSSKKGLKNSQSPKKPNYSFGKSRLSPIYFIVAII